MIIYCLTIVKRNYHGEYLEILDKQVLSHEDIRKFITFRYEGEEDVDFNTVDDIYKQVIRNNDIPGWDLLSDYEYYIGFQPPFDLCLKYAIRHGNEEMFTHILTAYATYTKAEYGEPIPINRLRNLASHNSHYAVRELVERLITILPNNYLDEEFAEQHQDQIQNLLAIDDEIKEPEYD
jgi:hypothetical protein